MPTKKPSPATRDVSQQLTAAQAREQLTYALDEGGFNIPERGHVRDRMQERDVSVVEIVKIAEKGVIPRAGEFENGSWRYQVWRGEVGIVVMFITADKSRVCTVLEFVTRKLKRQKRAAAARKKR